MSVTLISEPTNNLRKPSPQAKIKSLSALRQKIQARSVAANIEISELVKTGLPAQIVYSDTNLVARLVRTGTIARRTLAYAGEKNMEAFSPQVSEKIVRVIRINELAQDAFGEGAEIWLDRKSPVFDGKAPADMLATESGAHAVEMFINQSMHGFAA